MDNDSNDIDSENYFPPQSEHERLAHLDTAFNHSRVNGNGLAEMDNAGIST